MQSAPHINKIEKISFSFIFALGILTLSAFAIALLGINGIYFSMLSLLGLIISSFVYNKPKLFLFFALFIYPFTRILPLDDKFIITGSLYTLSIPCTIWAINKYFKQASQSSAYLWAMGFYIIIVLLNALRPETDIIDLAKEFGRYFFATLTILAAF
ncbi:MAG: hypothetical protein MZV70_76825 [Desulfobacterales bacterium]|nr:hypothetical protein [Desulfobacterales bacterium]